MKLHRLIFRISILIVICGGALTPAFGQPRGGDLLVVDVVAGINDAGALFSVDPGTGMRTLVSEFGQATQGPLGSNPVGLAIEESGTALVTASRLLFRVNTTTGVRTILSDFSNSAQGPAGVAPRGVAVGSDGAIFIADASSRLVFKVDPVSGVRTAVSNFNDVTQGPAGRTPFGIIVSQADGLFVADSSLRSGNLGGVFGVDPATGSRTLISDFGIATQGPLGRDPMGIDEEASGKILVADPFAGAGTTFTVIGALFRVYPADGSRVLLSDLSDPSRGVVGWGPTGLAVDGTGNILMTTQSRAGVDGPGGLLFRVDPATGFRTLLSDFGDASQGPVGQDPFDVAVIPINVTRVTIDIKPGSDENPINRRSRGNVPVALLSSRDFDATSADRRTVLFAGAPPLNIGMGVEDVNRDGLRDVVFHFDTQSLNLPADVTEACLNGQTSSGQKFEGCDSVKLK